MKRIALTLIMLVMSALITESFAGWVIKSRNTEIYGDGATEMYGDGGAETTWIQNNKMKSTGLGETTIINLSDGTITMIDEQDKTYWQVAIKDARDAFRQASQSFISEALKKVPEAQREMYRSLFSEMEKMYDDIDPDKISRVDIKVEKTGRSEQIAGYKAYEYHIFVNGSLVEQLWLTTDLDVSKDLNRKKMMEVMQELYQMGDDEMLYQFTDDYLDLLAKGYEMRSVDSGGEQTEVIGVEQKQLDASVFEVPAGYRKITIEEMMMTGFGDAGEEDDE
jgi:hypothetical protein